MSKWSEYSKTSQPDEKGVYNIVARHSGVGTTYWCPDHRLFRIQSTLDDDVLAFQRERVEKGERFECPLCAHAFEYEQEQSELAKEIAQYRKVEGNS